MEVNRLALPKGFRLSNYELSRVLGKGGFGITYLGVDRHLGRKVAVKELMPDSIVARVDGTRVEAQSGDLTKSWEWAKQRFLEEARVLAGFQHPNIVEVHQLVEANGTVYMVMDYIEGESYEARLRRVGRELDEHSMRQFLEPLMDGLEEVHTAGLLHRDIKPDNILLRRGIQPILIDFGSARKLLEGTSAMTSLVTHGYSPIEQYQVKGKQGPWTDIYALASVAVRAITGEKPPMSADRMSDDDFVWLSYRGLQAFSPLFLQALDWALRVKPNERPQNIREWRASFGWEHKPAFPGNSRVELVDSGDKTALGLEQPKKISQRLAPKPKTQPFPPAIPVVPASTGKLKAVSKAIRRVATKTPKTEPATSPILPAADSQGDALAPRLQKRALTVLAASAVALCGLGYLIIGHSGKHVRQPAEASVKTAAAPGTLGATAASDAAPADSGAANNLFTNSLGMKFAPVPGTNLLFSIWDTRVKDYRAFVQETGRDWRAPSFSQSPEDPAINVNWEDAKAFCQWLSSREGREYRLPTDAEWSAAVGLIHETGSNPHEKDSRVKETYPWGGSWPPPPNSGNYGASRMGPNDGFEKTSPVGKFPANPYGLYDMGGNVWQWCEDYYDNTPRRRVLRGGAWNSSTQQIMLSSFRYYAAPSDASESIGFRCVTSASGGR